jgi:hypothetical protein
MPKPINKIFERFRIAFRCLAAVCFVIPIASYLTFASFLDKVKYTYDYDTLERVVINDTSYQVVSAALSIGNQTWPILLPLSLAIGAIDVGISLYRQIASS